MNFHENSNDIISVKNRTILLFLPVPATLCPLYTSFPSGKNSFDPTNSPPERAQGKTRAINSPWRAIRKIEYRNRSAITKRLRECSAFLSRFEFHGKYRKFSDVEQRILRTAAGKVHLRRENHWLASISLYNFPFDTGKFPQRNETLLVGAALCWLSNIATTKNRTPCSVYGV